MNANTKVKIFTTGFINPTELINDFLEEHNATPVSVNILILHDRFHDGSICNQWQEVVLIYREEEEPAVYCIKCERKTTRESKMCEPCETYFNTVIKKDCVNELKKYYALPPHNNGSNPCHKDSVFGMSIYARFPVAMIDEVIEELKANYAEFMVTT